MAIRIVCDSCGAVHEVADERAGQTGRCPCGNLLPIPEEPAPPVQCQNCGTSNKPDASRCSKCNGPLNWEEAFTNPTEGTSSEDDGAARAPTLTEKQWIKKTAFAVFCVVAIVAIWVLWLVPAQTRSRVVGEWQGGTCSARFGEDGFVFIQIDSPAVRLGRRYPYSLTYSTVKIGGDTGNAKLVDRTRLHLRIGIINPPPPDYEAMGQLHLSADEVLTRANR